MGTQSNKAEALMPESGHEPRHVPGDGSLLIFAVVDRRHRPVDRPYPRRSGHTTVKPAWTSFGAALSKGEVTVAGGHHDRRHQVFGLSFFLSMAHNWASSVSSDEIGPRSTAPLPPERSPAAGSRAS